VNPIARHLITDQVADNQLSNATALPVRQVPFTI